MTRFVEAFAAVAAAFFLGFFVGMLVFDKRVEPQPPPMPRARQ
jgi:hypothetical protein